MSFFFLIELSTKVHFTSALMEIGRKSNAEQLCLTFTSFTSAHSFIRMDCSWASTIMHTYQHQHEEMLENYLNTCALTEVHE